MVTELALLLAFVLICLHASTSADAMQGPDLRRRLECYDRQWCGNGDGKLFGCDGHQDDGLEGPFGAGCGAGVIGHMAWNCGKTVETVLPRL
jgi:hypothetical protein